MIDVQILTTGSIKWSFAAGMLAYVAIFCSFSLLPVIPLTLLWIGLDTLLNLKNRNLHQTIKIILVFLVGFFSLHLLFKLFLNYDFILRCNNALAQHGLHKEFIFGLKSVIDAAVLNNVEFISWIGFPISILFISAVFHAVLAFHLENLELKDTLMFAFLSTYVMLNLFGQTRSEVARLWLYLVPMAAFFASTEAYRLVAFFSSKKVNITAAFLYIILLQLGTIFLTFKFQDLD